MIYHSWLVQSVKGGSAWTAVFEYLACDAFGRVTEIVNGIVVFIFVHCVKVICPGGTIGSVERLCETWQRTVRAGGRVRAGGAGGAGGIGGTGGTGGTGGIGGRLCVVNTRLVESYISLFRDSQAR